MDQGNPARRLRAGEHGLTSIQFLLASVLALLLFVAFANLVTVQYGRGAIRSALEQGVRAASVSGSAADCEVKAADVIAQLLGGRMSDDLEVECAVAGDRVAASARARFESWTPLAGDFTVTLDVEARREWDP